jgi:signal recognition particle GTPase
MLMGFAPKIANAKLSRTNEGYQKYTFQTSAGGITSMTVLEGHQPEHKMFGEIMRIATGSSWTTRSRT